VRVKPELVTPGERMAEEVVTGFVPNSGFVSVDLTCSISGLGAYICGLWGRQL
jgi:hypothetical protein